MRLIFTAGLKNLGSNRFRTICTVLGIALGVTTVATMLLLDHNTYLSESQVFAYIQADRIVAPQSAIQLMPLDRLNQTPKATAKRPENVMAEDYQIMRSTVRLASLLAFCIGAIIVFYTIGFSIQQRRKELALYSSLGATFSQIARLVLFEALILGGLGSLIGLFSAYPLFRILKYFEVTTTGRGTLFTEAIPFLEFLLVWVVGTITALLGALQPVLRLRHVSVTEALQPRFLSAESEPQVTVSFNLFSLIIPIMALTYLVMRPFLKQFIPSIFFYLGELAFIVSMFLMVIFLTPKIISIFIELLGKLLRHLFPLEIKLVCSRFTYFTQLISWPISNIMLVFAFLLTLHLVTKSLKQEVLNWGELSLKGLAFIKVDPQFTVIPAETLQQIGDHYTYVRFSAGTAPPNRVVIIEKEELAKYQARAPELAPVIEQFDAASVIMSTTMSQQLGVRPGDWVLLKSNQGQQKLRVIGVTDKLGFFPGDGTYRERKSYALIREQNAWLLQPNEARIGTQLILWNKARPLEPMFDYAELVRLNQLIKRRIHEGDSKVLAQVREIDKDFVIFDVILLLATLLAALGVTNTMLIQLQARRRELVLLQVLGMSTWQIWSMILVEGFLIGILGGMLAIFLGIPLSWASIEALNALSVFRIALDLSPLQIGGILVGAVGVSLTAAIYPALAEMQLPTSESIHYE